MLCKDDKRVTVKINRHNFKKKRWSRDEDHKECFKCNNSFNLFRRRHQYVFEAYLFTQKISQTTQHLNKQLSSMWTYILCKVLSEILTT